MQKKIHEIKMKKEIYLNTAKCRNKGDMLIHIMESLKQILNNYFYQPKLNMK